MQSFSLTINGEAAQSPGFFDVINPADGSVVARCPEANSALLDQAVAAARAAFPAWSALPDHARVDHLMKVADLLEANLKHLSLLVTQEQGKTQSGPGANLEAGGCVAWTRATAALSLKEETIEDSPTGRIVVRRKPVGVVGSITPWNWPLMIAVWHVMPALRVGCTVVIKPSPYTPLSTLRLVELMNQVLPRGVINVVTGDAEVGSGMISHPDINKIVFTGSINTGKKVMVGAADTLKRITLELGGNDAAIIMADVDVDAIADELFEGAFHNTAQVCVATKRMFIHADIYDRLRDRLHQLARDTPVGDGAEQGNRYGPIQNKAQYDRVLNLLEDARATGLTLLEGGKVPEAGYFVPLTLVDNPPDDARVVVEEAFGPVLPLLKFSDVEDVIARANDTEYGLAGAVWSKDIKQAEAIAHRLDTGTVWINQNLQGTPFAPLAGAKQSGFGQENGVPGLLEFTRPKTIYIPKTPAIRAPVEATTA